MRFLLLTCFILLIFDFANAQEDKVIREILELQERREKEKAELEKMREMRAFQQIQAQRALDNSLKRIDSLVGQNSLTKIIEEYSQNQYSQRITSISLHSPDSLPLHIEINIPENELFDISKFKYLSQEKYAIVSIATFSINNNVVAIQIPWIPSNLHQKTDTEKASILRKQIEKIYHRYRNNLKKKYHHRKYPRAFWQYEDSNKLNAKEKANFRESVLNILYQVCDDCKGNLND